MKLALGVDIGGTNTAFGISDKNGEIHYSNTLKTKAYQTADLLVEAIFRDLQKKDLDKNLVGIGVGAPNGNSATGNIEFAPNLKWKGIVPLSNMFTAKFGIPCFLSNDANAAAVGEKYFGCAKDLENFVVITLGTGLGSGIFINNELIEGANSLAGEYGHIRVKENGRSCGCGRKGCLETYASSTGVLNSVRSLSSDNKKNSVIGENSNTKEIFEAAKKGDLFANEIVDYTANILGNALADFACFSDPQAYVLFGGLAQSGSFLADKVKKSMNDNLLNIYKDKIEVRVSKLQNKDAALLGNIANLFWKINER